MYSQEEYVNMVQLYNESGGNAYEARRRYIQRFPNRRVPSPQVFRRAMLRFQMNGNVNVERRQRQRPVADIHEDEVFRRLRNNPHLSIRALGEEMGISRSSVHRILQANRWHPYRMTLVQDLSGNDYERRVHYCEAMLGILHENPDIMQQVLWCDPSSFRNDGTVNRHKWSNENPYWIREAHVQVRWKLNVWCGILGDHIIGPYFFRRRLTGNRFLHFVRNNLSPVGLLEDVPLALATNHWLQLDGAPPHRYRGVTRYLDRTYPDRWIGYNGFVNWPARSPDLTPLDFFLWGHLKSKVYATRPENPADLRRRIIAACRTVTPEMLRRVHSET